MTFISYAQNFEDVLLWRAFGHLDRGFYIDVGAAHPDIDSVTRAFYDRGWTGINIEPVPEYAVRLTAARPRDINLCVALAAARGRGTLHVVAGTGLSTTVSGVAEQHRAGSLDVRAQEVAFDTLAEICSAYAPAAIHFLKIDVEGAERAVLQGADFAKYRPHIVLVEATAPGTTVCTHDDWETVLLGADYRFLWFDGLNRFYAAAERYDALAGHFGVPVCVFDNFLRAADTEWTRRISHAEMQVLHAQAQGAELLEQAMVADAGAEAADARAREAEARARQAEQRAIASEQRLGLSDHRALLGEQRAHAMEARAAAAEHLVRHNEAQNAAEMHRLNAALRRSQDEESALRASTSWRLTAPLRGAVETTRALAGRGRAPAATQAELPPASAAPKPEAAAPDRQPATMPPRRTVHQFHSGSAVGDAITNALLLIRTQLRAMGYCSDIFVEHRDPLLEHELRPAAELPIHDDYVLILHHSMGFDAYDRIVALSAPKILVYHNITPPEFFADQPYVQHMARRGREQLAGLRRHVVSALAVSEYNAIELRALGFADVAACMLLFDLAALRRQAPARADRAGRPFTILFIGRIVASKGQQDLLEAFAVFHRLYQHPCRLVLVGRGDGVGQFYREEIEARIAERGLSSEVVLTGLVSDEALLQHLSEADLYVSLSRHEGFGVPLVEASACGIAVLAWPAGAVAYTIGVPEGLLQSLDPDSVSARMLALAEDAGARTALARAQFAALDRFTMAPQLARLSAALLRAGAAAPAPPAQSCAESAALLEANARYTVCGHVNRTYSLAAINRTLARTLDRAFPGRVRLEPVEGEPTRDLAEVPDAERDSTAALCEHPPHQTGPIVVISQHYPVYVPPERGDVLLAFVFWEESLIPAATIALLNGSFDAVLAPSRYVAKVLVDSGLRLPVHTVGYAPELGRYLALPGKQPDPAGLFTFLHVSSAFPRKGLDVLLAAYARAFRAADPVRLVVKSFPNPHNDAAAQIEALRTADPDAPAITLIDRDLDEDGILALYRDADAMVLPTRGEGFNLPAAEAMAAGVPLIVTDEGGHRDFCDAHTARLVASHPAVSKTHLASAMSLWAEPDAEDLAEALREAVADRSTSRERARKARLAVAETLDPARTTRAIAAAASSALLRARQPPLRLCVVTSWNVRCGVAGYARLLVKAMRQADPAILVTILSDKRAAESIVADIPVQPCWTLGVPDISELMVALAQQDPHAVIIQHQPGLLDWPSLGRLLTHISAEGRTGIATLHNTAHLGEIDAEQLSIAIGGLKAASRIVVHTLADIERLRGFGLDGNIVLVPQGAPPALPAPQARMLVSSEPVVIGCCGFLLPGKGIPALVQALALVRRKWHGATLRLLNARYDNPLSDEEAGRVREAIRMAGLEMEVDLVTEYLPFDEARTRLSACDIVVLPYPHSKEASSAALRMALSAGPCVAVTPIALFEEAGAAVYRLPGTDPAAIADGIVALLGDQPIRHSIAVHAQAWVAARSWEAVGTRVAGMIRGLSATPAPHDTD